MSKFVKNYVYAFGQKKENAAVHVISKEHLEEIKKSVSKYEIKKSPQALAPQGLENY